MGAEQRKESSRAKAAADYVSIERPPEGRLSPYTQLKLGDETVLAFALKDQEVAEYHYRFYHLLATLMADHWTDDVETRYIRILRDELNADVHGEVDEPSWRLKQALRRSQATGAVKLSRVCAAIFHRYADPIFARHLLRHRRGYRVPASFPAGISETSDAAGGTVPAAARLCSVPGTAGRLTFRFRAHPAIWVGSKGFTHFMFLILAGCGILVR